MRAHVLVAIMIAGAVAGPAQAAAAPSGATAWRTTLVSRNSGLVDGEAGKPPRKIDMGVVELPGAPWLRVVFGDCVLGDSSRIMIRSGWNQDWQQLDARALRDWGGVSAVFNGDRVEIQLIVAPGDRGVRATVRGAVVGVGQPLSPQSQCGNNDDRVASSDNRVGRLYFGGCTAWRIGNGAFLTAGHCADLDPDQFGPMLPDGVLDLTGVVEFNVPLSLANGTPVAAAPQHQYPINRNKVQWRFDGEGMGLGKDWCVFEVNANANTGLLPHQAYGAPFRISREIPSANTVTRLTGFGSDAGVTNFTNQTVLGPFVEEDNDGGDIWLRYVVDSQGGNSGGPVIWDGTDICIGIHTNSGCAEGAGGNSGTSFEVDPLEIAINNFIGSNTMHVDNGHGLPMAEGGSLMRPWNTIVEATNIVVPGAVVSVFTGNYSVPAGTTITRAMTISASVGAVTITGN